MKKSLLIFFLIIPFIVLSQSNESYLQKKTIILKLKTENRNIISGSSIQNNELKNLVNISQPEYFNKLFPNHKPPQNSFDEYGNKLVDLSLIYQLKYTANIQEYILIEKLKALNLFEYVEQRIQNKLLYIPDDTLISNQFHLENLKLYDAWDIEQGDTNVVIGITDTGADRLHEDLQNIKYNYDDPIDGVDNDNDGFVDNYYGWDVGDNDNEPQFDLSGHGVFVTGISSAVVDNNIGIAGTGFKSKYLPVKVLNSAGSLIYDYEGIVYAADQNCDIINASWGGLEGSRFGEDIINYATYNKNSLVVAACGNSDNANHLYPASYKNVFSCSGLDSNDVKWVNSSYGTTVDIAGPGTGVYSSWPGDVYFASGGTSFSAPAIAGIAALVKSHFPTLNAIQIAEKIRVTADVIDTIPQNIPYTDMLGAGRANAYQALVDSVKPSFRVLNHEFQFTGENAGDTVFLKTEIINYLEASSQNAKVVISTSSPYLGVMDSIFNIGNLLNNSTADNYQMPFSIKILPNMPNGFRAAIKLEYTDTAYRAIEYLHLEMKEDYLNIDTNNVLISLTSNGAIGFTDESKAQGVGMYYKNSRNLLSSAGLFFGNSQSRVSDNIYDDGGWGHDFKTLNPISTLSNDWDEAYITTFNDDSAANTKLDVEVIQKIYASNKPDENDFVVFDYTFVNKSAVALNDFYVGLFADFDIDVSGRNIALYDSLNKMVYTKPVSGGVHAAIKIINENDSVSYYNLTNNGSNGSINLYDGFLDFEKYQSLTVNRDSAGFDNPNGADVSNIIGKGPFNFLQNDSINVKFAFLASEHIVGLRNTAAKIEDAFDDNTSVTELNDFPLNVEISPNPAKEKIKLSINSEVNSKAVFQLINQEGKINIISSKQINQGNNINFIDVSELDKGIYFLKIEINNRTETFKIIKI